MNIQLQYSILKPHQRLEFLDVAANPSFNLLLTRQKEFFQGEILAITQAASETDAAFIGRLKVLISRLRDVESFISLNEEIIVEHTYQIQQRN